MSTLIFHNPGEIDIRGACIAGLSAKEGDSPIGYFGTGLKYSIACIIRWGGEITIYSGEQKYVFVGEGIDYRGQEFQQVVMRKYGEGHYVETSLGFTTEYGKNWQPWQVFRELYANARDEGGGVTHAQINITQDYQCPAIGHTRVLIHGVPDLLSAYYERDNIILPAGKIWDYTDARLSFSAAPSSGIYYRNVRVQEQPCLYTWNFTKKLTLTEDRTLKSLFEISYDFDEFINNNCRNEEVIQHILELKFKLRSDDAVNFIRDGKPMTGRTFEGQLVDWLSIPTSKHSCSGPFQTVACRMYQRDPIKCAALRPLIKSIDEELIKRAEYIMSAREQMMFDKAKELVALFGFEEEINRVPIHVQELGPSLLGLYENDAIYLSPTLFDQGTKQLVATLYEECYHHRTAHQDCTYNMQSSLFNIIISLNEELHKVIC